jgi:hypothetical protein
MLFLPRCGPVAAVGRCRPSSSMDATISMIPRLLCHHRRHRLCLDVPGGCMWGQQSIRHGGRRVKHLLMLPGWAPMLYHQRSLPKTRLITYVFLLRRKIETHTSHHGQRALRHCLYAEKKTSELGKDLSFLTLFLAKTPISGLAVVRACTEKSCKAKTSDPRNRTLHEG